MTIISILILGGLGMLMATILFFAHKKLKVEVDEKIVLIYQILPQANCGACGYAGCENYAEAIVKGEAEPNRCTVGGKEVAEKIGEILGIEVKASERKVAVLTCQGGVEECPERFIYDGHLDCKEANLLHQGNKACIFGCLGLGTCVKVCPFSAIKMDEKKKLPVIDEEKCTGCGICVKECPKGVLKLIPKGKLVYLACVSSDKGREVREVCKVGCFACNICVKACPYSALRMENNLPVMDFEKCVDCGICYQKCPTKSYVDKAKKRPYALIDATCNGCGECVKVCQFKAIEGKLGERHKVIIENCVGCGECFRVCPIKAITMVGALGYTKKEL
jgi:electron transport complex protein RnfB